MLRDFSDAWHDSIDAQGELTPPITLAVSGITYTPDPDGLIGTTPVFGRDGEECLLTMLFPMTWGEAEYRCKKKKLPLKPGQFVTVVHKQDVVRGRSGESYGRFIVQPENSNWFKWNS